MDTKDRILKAALQLFNSKGTELVTVREIAKKVGISHGNLCYHFPTTDDIIERLYLNLVDELDSEMRQMQSQTQAPTDVFKGTRLMFDLLYKYKFLMLNFVDVMRRLPKVNKHYRQLQERRKYEFKLVFNNLVAAGIMKPEIYPGFFDHLIINMTIIGDFWVAHSEILYNGPEKEKLDFFYKTSISLMAPLLTEEGAKLFVEAAKSK